MKQPAGGEPENVSGCGCRARGRPCVPKAWLGWQGEVAGRAALAAISSLQHFPHRAGR